MTNTITHTKTASSGTTFHAFRLQLLAPSKGQKGEVPPQDYQLIREATLESSEIQENYGRKVLWALNKLLNNLLNTLVVAFGNGANKGIDFKRSRLVLTTVNADGTIRATLQSIDNYKLQFSDKGIMQVHNVLKSAVALVLFELSGSEKRLVNPSFARQYHELTNAQKTIAAKIPALEAAVKVARIVVDKLNDAKNSGTQVTVKALNDAAADLMTAQNRLKQAKHDTRRSPVKNGYGLAVKTALQVAEPEIATHIVELQREYMTELAAPELVAAIA